jgi:hypothetical protein
MITGFQVSQGTESRRKSPRADPSSLQGTSHTVIRHVNYSVPNRCPIPCCGSVPLIGFTATSSCVEVLSSGSIEVEFLYDMQNDYVPLQIDDPVYINVI